MAGNIEIVPATVDDLDRVTDLWVDLARDQQQYGSHLEPESNRRTIREAMARHAVDETLVVARDRDDDVVGFVMFDVENGPYRQDVTRGIVQNVYVAPRVRNEGVGSALVAAAEDMLDAAGVDVVAIEAMADNDGARRLYRRRGYQPHRIEFEKQIKNDTHTRQQG